MIFDMGKDHDMKVGDRFTIEYDPEADPDGVFAFLQTAKFEVTAITPTSIKCKRVS